MRFASDPMCSDELLEELLRPGAGLHQPVPGGDLRAESEESEAGHAHLGAAQGDNIPQEHRQLLRHERYFVNKCTFLIKSF